MRRAFSYARFSSAKQADGVSLARQLEAAQRYCERHGLTLDEQTFADHGVSGFKGRNSKDGDLAVFIDLVVEGRIPKGSVLIVENTDRLSRLPPDEANHIITTIVKAGVDIVTTSPEQVYTKANINQLATWLPLQVSNCLAHEESRKKSDRLKDVWARRRAALADGKVATGRGPFWLKLAEDRKTWVVVEEWAAVVRDLFQWVVDGLGLEELTKRLQLTHPAGITGKGWRPPNVIRIVKMRSTIGEFQPTVGRGKELRPAGPAVVGYYPAIVSDELFHRAQETIRSRTRGRKHGGGRQEGTPNLFGGLIYDAADGHTMVVHARHKNHWRALVSSGAVRKVPGSKFKSVPVEVVESAVLSRLVELTATDVTGTGGTAEDAVATASAKLTDVNRKIGQMKALMLSADDPSVYVEMVDALTLERKQVVGELEAAKGRAVSPAGDALGECASLASLIGTAEGDEREELRRRIKAAVGRLVERIDVLLGPEGRGGYRGTQRRTAAFRVKFLHSDRSRIYVVTYGKAGIKVYAFASNSPMDFTGKEAIDRMTKFLGRGAAEVEGFHEKLLAAVARTAARRQVSETVENE